MLTKINTLPGLEHVKDRYYIASNGTIYSHISDTMKPMKPSNNGSGYMKKSLQDILGGQAHCYIHILVAKAFIPNPQNKPTVDHIDRDRTNNDISNLRWATYTEQANNKTHNGKPRDFFDVFDKITGEEVGHNLTVNEITEIYGISYRRVSDMKHGRRKSSKGYTVKLTSAEAQ